MSQQASGWYADPAGRHTYRYWDGSGWSKQVSDGGTAGVDPVDLDEATAATPPAPGTQAPGMQPTTAVDAPQSPGVQVTQGSSGTGLTGILGVLVGAVIVVVILVVLFNNAGDDGSTASTDAPAATVTTQEPPTSEAPATTAP
jgi:hypothetical protein